MEQHQEVFLDGRVTLWCGDMLAVLAQLPDDSLDACVCDPPYHLHSIVKRFAKTGRTDKTRTTSGPHQRTAAGFMNKQWDGGDIAWRCETWEAVYRVLKPGAYLLAFGGTRTYGRLQVAIEDAGFVVYDMIAWLYGSGFPKSHSVSKAIDRKNGAVREVVAEGTPVKRMIPGADQNKAGWEKNNGRVYVPTKTKAATPEAAEWDGFGSALKPALEPICLAQKPRDGTIAENVVKWGTGALNIDACRVMTGDDLNGGGYGGSQRHDGAENWRMRNGGAGEFNQPPGRWPANVIHDGSEEATAAFPDTGVSAGGRIGNKDGGSIYGGGKGLAGTYEVGDPGFGDSGSAARFFYTAKADSDDRLGSKHPTVKPLDLMQYLVRLVTPPNGIVLDPFAGTGTTGEAAWREKLRAVLVEREPEYQADIRRRMALALAGPDERVRESLKAAGKTKPPQLTEKELQDPALAAHGWLFAAD